MDLAVLNKEDPQMQEKIATRASRDSTPLEIFLDSSDESFFSEEMHLAAKIQPASLSDAQGLSSESSAMNGLGGEPETTSNSTGTDFTLSTSGSEIDPGLVCMPDHLPSRKRKQSQPKKKAKKHSTIGPISSMVFHGCVFKGCLFGNSVADRELEEKVNSD